MRVLPLLAAFLLSACSPVYVVKSASGHLGFLSRARRVDKLLKDPEIDPKTREKLELVAAVRGFSFKEMGLKPNKDYSRVSRIKGPYVTYTVMASDKTAFRSHEWWFPFVGRVPYKGHFSMKDAAAEAGRLERKGLDVFVGGVSAYNTPLPFADPLAHTQLELPPGQLAELIIHELAHGTVFFKGHIGFDEALASFVGEAGAVDFLDRRFGPDSAELAAFRESMAREQRHASEMERLYFELDGLYKAGLPRDEALSKRAPILASGREKLKAALGYDPGELNNASIMAHRIYRRDLHLFREAHERLGREWKATIGFFRSLDRRGPGSDLEARLEKLRAVP
ncbi:MAG: aminopeptidase [Elusimicrobia bacterium]|nr:aminopeptidase [Elusimicrobiota bacterium]